MIIRGFLIGAVAVSLSASTASAQGQPQKQIVLPKSVLRSLVANKPKTKRPLGAQVGIGRRAHVVSTKSQNAAPTSVKEIRPIAGKK